MQENNVWIGKDENMEDIKKYFAKDKTIQNFIFPKYYKVYRRSVSSSMSKALIYLYKWNKEFGEKEWCKLSDYIILFKESYAVASGGNSKLRYFNLVELKSPENDGQLENKGDTSCVGYYKITEEGKAFVKNNLMIPKYAYVCKGVVLGYSDEKVSILETIKNHFNYYDIFN